MNCVDLCPPLRSSVGRVKEGRVCWCRLNYTREQRTAWNSGQKETDKKKRNNKKAESILSKIQFCFNVNI